MESSLPQRMTEPKAMPGSARAMPVENSPHSGRLKLPLESIFAREKVPYCMRKKPKPKYSSSHHWRPFQLLSKPIKRAMMKFAKGRVKSCTRNE